MLIAQDNSAAQAAAAIAQAPTPAVRVSVSGQRGTGRFFIIDRHIWERISPTLGSRWSLLVQGGQEYLYSSSADARRAAPLLRTKSSIVFLHRIVAAAIYGEAPKATFFKSANHLDLRAVNITRDRSETPSAIAAAARASAQGVTVEDYVEA